VLPGAIEVAFTLASSPEAYMKANSASRSHREHFSKAAESHLRALIDSTSDVIWSVDLDYCLVTFNKAFADSVQLNWGVRIQHGMAFPGALPADAVGNWTSLYEYTLAEGPTTTRTRSQASPLLEKILPSRSAPRTGYTPAKCAFAP
jgi:PAS domain-containing protein